MPKYGTDLSKTAIDLKNPLEVRDLLLAYGKAEAIRNWAQEAHDLALDAMPTYQALQRDTTSMETAHKAVKEAIDRCGSLQDIPEGLYAVKQGRNGISYNPKMVRECMPQFAEAVIVEAVDPVKINGLIKGKLIDEVTQERITIITPLAPAYIIGVAQKPVDEVTE